MEGEGGGGRRDADAESAVDDSFLRAVARAPERSPQAASVAGPSAAGGAEPDLVGRNVLHFRIVERLGAGGMGVVYKAIDETLRRPVALKLLPDASGNDEKRQRFLREARSAAAITHPNVAVVHQVGEAEGRVYIAMELVDGESLRARLERGRLDPATARELGGQIARGLAAAHDKGIVHRDLKPENVMITPAGVVKLLDFGLAKSGVDRPASGDTEAGLAKTETVVTSDEGRIMGTPAYMSPEQALGEALDVRSDVFSLGIVLYEMLCGTRPFKGPSTGAVLVAIARDAVPSLRARAPEVDEATEAVVMRCLAKAPAERFASAGEIVEALSTPLAPKATTESRTDVAPLTRSGDPRRVASRSGVRTAVAIFVALVAAVGGGWWWTSRRTAPSLAPRESVGAGASASAASAEGLPRSLNAEAQRSFEEAMRSFHDGTGQAVPLLQKAVQADPSFGGAYLRLALVAALGKEGGEHADEYHRRAVALESTLSARDRALLDCLGESYYMEVNAKLDAYLSRYPDDDVAWVLRLDSTLATSERALAAEPTLVPALADEAQTLGRLRRWSDAMTVVARCLDISARAADCLKARANLLDKRGDCAAAEKDVRRLLELQPDSREAHPLLAGLLAAQGASAAAVQEALGNDLPLSVSGAPMLVEGLVPMLEGQFTRAERLAKDAMDRTPSRASDSEHLGPAWMLVLASTEAGDLARAGRVAAEYLSRRVAWKQPFDEWVGYMVGAAVRGGRIDRGDADRRLDAAFRILVDKKVDAGAAWAAVYAAAADTRDESLAAVNKLETLGVAVPWTFRGASSRALFKAGRGGEARPLFEDISRDCSGVLIFPREWLRTHLYLGELDEQAGNSASACGHYAKVLERWGHATPRSVTADEARAHATKLGCAP